MPRKYYFTPFTDIDECIQSIKSRADIAQLCRDLCASGSNLFEFRCGVPGVWSLDDRRGKGLSKRHVFMLRGVHEAINLSPAEREQMTSLTIIEE